MSNYISYLGLGNSVLGLNNTLLLLISKIGEYIVVGKDVMSVEGFSLIFWYDTVRYK